jgi:hypothetical protein
VRQIAEFVAVLSCALLLADHEPIERSIIPRRNSWGHMDTRFSHCHSWAGSFISSCLPTIRPASCWDLAPRHDRMTV